MSHEFSPNAGVISNPLLRFPWVRPSTCWPSLGSGGQLTDRRPHRWPCPCLGGRTLCITVLPLTRADESQEHHKPFASIRIERSPTIIWHIWNRNRLNYAQLTSLDTSNEVHPCNPQAPPEPRGLSSHECSHGNGTCQRSGGGIWHLHCGIH